ncbi:MAG: NADPH-dependent glutamate synthase [Candidatus Omnitrophica bacterium]|nr:NADPH-dependent glutamate synthase [Candidatus Omnitrophota bacterium]
MKRKPVNVREQDHVTRAGNFSEVVQGYTEEEALGEAVQCLQCKNPVCITGCPVGIDIKKFIGQICAKDYPGAYFTIREKNNFPLICGRVCPAEYQCRKACVLTKKGLPFAGENAINIHFLERFIGDYGRKHNLTAPLKKDDKLASKKVAVVGSGPAGLSCAGELARVGVKVTMYEGLHRPGGVLCYGIPPFRLPQDVMDYEIDYLKTIGVDIIQNVIIGKTKSLDQLFRDGYSAVFLGLGAGTPSFLGIPGENLCNVYSANEFLTRANLMKAYEFPKAHTPINIGAHIIVIGGGNTAMDAARVAVRIQRMKGIEPNVTVVYRRTENELPARRLEIAHAKEEGVKFEFLVAPKAFIGDEYGSVRKLVSLRCRLGEPDSSGRRRPVPIEGSEFEINCDVAVLAIGLQANQILNKATPALKTDKYGDIIVHQETMETSIPNVYAGGDIVGGEGTVIEAMSMGKKAAAAIIAGFLK